MLPEKTLHILQAYNAHRSAEHARSLILAKACNMRKEQVSRSPLHILQAYDDSYHRPAMHANGFFFWLGDL